ncbi:site-specific integrase, partial [Lawsonibacter sp. NSJ-51]|nr:site-specific integrase [Lawsonibacter hominis]
MPAVHLQENSKLISGHVAEKKGYLYWVLNLTDENGKRKPKWIPTHKKVKGNKTWANNMLPTIRKEWTEKLLQEAAASQQSASPSGPSSAEISFVDFLYQWLEYKYKSATGRVMDSKPIELSTYSGYEQQLNNPIAPYFREHPVALCDLTKQDILAFYEKELERVKPTTVK